MTTLPAHLRERFARQLAQLVALPSVAAEGRALAETAEAVAGLLRELGLDAEIHATDGAPVVFAERRVPGAPTVLFYNHYDVQPADPLERWSSDPFELSERDGALYGRGAGDDKGELVARLVALQWLRERHGGEIPIGVVMLIEGEEEVGSPSMDAYVEAHAERLAADVAFWEAGVVDAADRPQLICGLKGVVSVDLSVRTAAYDQHSGSGPVVPNAAWRMAAAVASLRDADGRVLIDGFYDRVRPPTEVERAIIEASPDESARLGSEIGVERFHGGATGSEFQRRLQLEPIVNVNGIHSGYGGPGTKTVLPAEASAKLDIRLVPDQDPLEVVALLRSHLDRHGFSDVTLSHRERPGLPARVDPTHPWLQHAAAALEEAHGVAPVITVSSGGSGPMHPFVERLGLPVAMVGVNHAGGRIHSPDEHVRWRDVERGIVALMRTMERYAEGWGRD